MAAFGADRAGTPRQTLRIEEASTNAHPQRRAPLLRSDPADQATWVGRSRVLDLIEQPAAEVVLARHGFFAERTRFCCCTAARGPEAPFAFQPEDGATFLGVSPERLYRREGRRIFSEAVAGTRRRGDSGREDQAMGDALLESEKDRREHRFVADEVGRKLDGLCRSYRADREVSLLKLARLQHLRRGLGPLRPASATRRSSPRCTRRQRSPATRRRPRSPRSSPASRSTAAGTPARSAGSARTAPTSRSRSARGCSAATGSRSTPAPASSGARCRLRNGKSSRTSCGLRAAIGAP
jgi:hypothetical protein